MNLKDLQILFPVIQQAAYVAAILELGFIVFLLIIIRTLWNSMQADRLAFDAQREKWLTVYPELSKVLASQAAATAESNSLVRMLALARGIGDKS